jgi:ferredoxin
VISEFLAFDSTKCTGCGACIVTCPIKAIKPGPNKIYIDSQRCNLCFDCIDICPKNAILLNHKQHIEIKEHFNIMENVS